MRRYSTILGLAAAVMLAFSWMLWRDKSLPEPLKMLDITVTYAGLTNDVQGKPLVSFRIWNPYPRVIWYVPPKMGSTNLNVGSWRSKNFHFLGPYQSEIVNIRPPLQDPGTNVWGATFRAGIKQAAIQRVIDPVVDKMQGTSRRYGDNIGSVRMQGLRPTPNGALFSAILEGDHDTVSRAISDGAILDWGRGWTMLHLTAMYSGSTNIARILLQQGVSPSALDKDGDTAEDIARNNRHADLARFLEALRHDPEGLPELLK